MSFRPLSAHGGLRADVAFEDGKMIVRHSQDAEKIVENNKRWQADGDRSGPLRRIASIPTTVIYRWLVEDGILPGQWMRMNRRDKAAFYRRKLNDPDYRYLKATPERL